MCYPSQATGEFGFEEACVTSLVPGRNDQFRIQLKTVLRTLERDVNDLLDNFWEEPLRRHAHETAAALLEGCKTCGFLELAGVTRAITSLLALPMEDVLSLETALREKFKELLGLLKELAAMIAA